MKQTENHIKSRSITFPKINGSGQTKVRLGIKKEQPLAGTTPLKPNEDTHSQPEIQINVPEFGEFNNSNDTSNNSENSKKQPDHVLLKMAAEAEIDLSKSVITPPVALTLDGETLQYLGDLSLTIGKAKSRKTFLNTLLMAKLVENSSKGRIRATLPEDKRMVLSFDTEQGSFHAHKAAKRVLQLLKINDTPYFKAYGLRKYTPPQRLQLIEFIIYNTPNLGVVFIDGIRDLITSINDEIQATMITSKLMKWTEELNIHINCVLHMNKGDNNARGHVGTEMLNKSLTTISVAKISTNPQYSIVEVIESRDKEPAPFILGIDETGLPYIVSESEVSSMKTESRTRKSVHPSDMDSADHFEILKNKIFRRKKQQTYSELLLSVKGAYNVGISKAKNLIAYFIKEAFISSLKNGNKTIYGLV